MRSEMTTASPASRARSPYWLSPSLRGSAGRTELAEKVHEREHVVAPAGRAPALRDPLPHHADPDSLEVDQAHEAQRQRQLRAVDQLGRLPEAHRGGPVEEDVEAQVLLVHEQLQVEPVEAAVDVPVD